MLRVKALRPDWDQVTLTQLPPVSFPARDVLSREFLSAWSPLVPALSSPFWWWLRWWFWSLFFSSSDSRTEALGSCHSWVFLQLSAYSLNLRVLATNWDDQVSGTENFVAWLFPGICFSREPDFPNGEQSTWAWGQGCQGLTQVSLLASCSSPPASNLSRKDRLEFGGEGSL